MDLNQKIKEFVEKLNAKGIPLPMIRDPKSQEASVSLTLVFISSACVLISLIGKISSLLKGVDVENSLEFFLISCGLYFGRNLSKKTISNGDKQ